MTVFSKSVSLTLLRSLLHAGEKELEPERVENPEFMESIGLQLQRNPPWFRASS